MAPGRMRSCWISSDATRREPVSSPRRRPTAGPMTSRRRHITRRRAGTLPGLIACALALSLAPRRRARPGAGRPGTGGLEARPGETGGPPRVAREADARDRAATSAPRTPTAPSASSARVGSGELGARRRPPSPTPTARSPPSGAPTPPAATRCAPPSRATSETATTAAAKELLGRVSVFAPATASWYGPGFFGRRTACGIKLTKRTLGVAHKKLPCGTKVEFLYRGRTIVVPVIDRGPFIAGRQWDLTQATAEALDVRATVRVGVLPAPVGALASRAAARRPARPAARAANSPSSARPSSAGASTPSCGRGGDPDRDLERRAAVPGHAGDRRGEQVRERASGGVVGVGRDEPVAPRPLADEDVRRPQLRGRARPPPPRARSRRRRRARRRRADRGPRPRRRAARRAARRRRGAGSAARSPPSTARPARGTPPRPRRPAARGRGRGVGRGAAGAGAKRGAAAAARPARAERSPGRRGPVRRRRGRGARGRGGSRRGGLGLPGGSRRGAPSLRRGPRR